jgi:hypothetical protein
MNRHINNEGQEQKQVIPRKGQQREGEGKRRKLRR